MRFLVSSVRVLAKNNSFGISCIGFCFGKNQMCLFAGRLFTLSDNDFGLCVRAGWRAKSCQTETNAGAGYKVTSLHDTPPDAKPVLAARGYFILLSLFFLIFLLFCLVVYLQNIQKSMGRLVNNDLSIQSICQ